MKIDKRSVDKLARRDAGEEMWPATIVWFLFGLLVLTILWSSGAIEDAARAIVRLLG